MTPSGCRRHGSPQQAAGSSESSLLAEDPGRGAEAERARRKEGARAFASHNPASTFPCSSWLSFFISPSRPYALSFPAQQSFLTLLAVCAIPSCDWQPQAPSICLLRRHPRQLCALPAAPRAPAPSRRAHLRGLRGLSPPPSGTGNLSGTNILKSRFGVANLSLLYIPEHRTIRILSVA